MSTHKYILQYLVKKKSNDNINGIPKYKHKNCQKYIHACIHYSSIYKMNYHENYEMMLSLVD